MKRSRALAVVLVIAALSALDVTACSSSSKKISGPTTAAGSSTSAPAAPPGKSPIKIGVMAALTGGGSTSQGAVVGVTQAWTAWVNAQGGINGHPVTIDMGDTQTDAAAGLVAAHKLAADGVVGVVMLDDSVEAPLVDYFNTRKLAVVGSVPDLGGSTDNLFNISTGQIASAGSATLIAKSAGASSFAAVVCAEVAACASADGFFRATAKSAGIAYDGILTAPNASPSFTAQCLTLISRKAGYVLLGLTAATAQRVIQDCNKQGFAGIYGAADNVVVGSSLKVVSGVHLVGDLGSFPWWVSDAPVVTFRAAMAKYSPGKPYDESDATHAWAGLEFFRVAMANVPDAPTPSDLFAGLYALHDETLNGLLPQPVNFTPGKPSPALSCFFLFKYADGTFSAYTVGGSGNGQTAGLQSSCYPSK